MKLFIHKKRYITGNKIVKYTNYKSMEYQQN